ncbi:MAG: virulence-related protein, partial [Clostridiaceae bacterium]
AYIIDRNGAITNSQNSVITLEDILNTRNSKEEVQTIEDEHREMQLGVPFEEHTGRTLLNIINMIYSKQNLITKSLGITGLFMDEAFVKNMNIKKTGTLEEFHEALTEVGAEGCKGIIFDFEERTLTFKLAIEDLDTDKIDAFKELVIQINKNAKNLKHTSFKQSQDDNPKYAFRTWLIRLGMNGSKYKVIRKTLLSNLEGSAAYRKISNEGEVQVNG